MYGSFMSAFLVNKTKADMKEKKFSNTYFHTPLQLFPQEESFVGHRGKAGNLADYLKTIAYLYRKFKLGLMATI